MSIKQKIARKAVKKTAKHTTRGAASKLKRTPMRSTTLLGLGAAFGLLAGWMLGRSGGEPEPAA
ncbi:MAG TPA: hypothetical protein VFB52_07180 [Solirubrobacterales bacterium]|nr:hypothetical protein [Solirubrobacterales bacterium]